MAESLQPAGGAMDIGLWPLVETYIIAKAQGMCFRLWFARFA